jgi:predicted dehydrogenase
LSLDVGLIGCGRWGRLILRDLVALGARVHVVQREPSHEALVGAGASSTHEEVASLPTVAGFVVATPTSAHAEVIESVLGTGKPVFVEKPMTASVDTARRIVAAAPERVFVMDKWRYHNGIEAIRAAVRAGLVGTPLVIRLARWSVGHAYDDVGPLWILAPHDLSIVLHIFGHIPEVRCAFPHFSRRPDLGIVARLGGHDGEIEATLDVGVLSPEHSRRVVVIGSEGSLELAGGYAEQLVHCRGKPGVPGPHRTEIPFEPNMPLLAELRAFLTYLQGGPAPMSNAREGLLIVERIAAIEKLAGEAV